MNIAQNYAQVSWPLSHTIQYSKMLFFCWNALFIRKIKIKMADRKKHVLSKVVKNIIFQNKTFTSNVLVIKHFGTNFVILNIFWKQKIVKTVWPVRVKGSVLAFV